jgi:hypothetical protein
VLSVNVSPSVWNGGTDMASKYIRCIALYEDGRERTFTGDDHAINTVVIGYNAFRADSISVTADVGRRSV